MAIRLKRNEAIVLEIRRYGLTYIFPVILGIVCFSVAAFFLFWFMEHDWWGITLLGILVVMGLFIFLKTWLHWARNKTIITTHRIVDIDKPSLFQEIVSEVPYDKIEDTTGKIRGMLGTIFRYGSVEIITGNEEATVILDRVKQPARIQQQINELRERHMARYTHEFSGDVASLILDKLYELDKEDLLKVLKTVRKRLKKIEQSAGSK
ncbi:MAG: hypothetical protein HOE80_01075 [Candidatus Magasanikbacteria bacterium]|jgi:membrane protein YdbS with pleckstrin-like domain|nr:hypothetical protein [Candidatus Magasanikbacteria bacterium]MBT4071296.1 hypothetical protein [Candidatus Magasanikbacteria bacterium]